MALKAGRVGVAPDQVDEFGKVKSDDTSGYTKQEADSKFETKTEAAAALASVVNAGGVSEDINVKSLITFEPDVVFDATWTRCIKRNSIVDMELKFHTPANMAADKHILGIPNSLKPSTHYANRLICCPLSKAWTGEHAGVLQFVDSGASGDICGYVKLATNQWTVDTDVICHFSYILD